MDTPIPWLTAFKSDKITDQTSQQQQHDPGASLQRIRTK